VPGPQRCTYRKGAPIIAITIVVLCAAPVSRVPAAWETATSAREPATPARANPPVPSGNPLWGISLSALPATSERPIFSPARRPPAPVVYAVAAAEPPKLVLPPPEPSRPPLVLVGTIIGESRQIGIFLEETTKETVRLTTGEGHSGWLLRSVDARGVQFERGERSATLVLRPPHQTNAAGSETRPIAELMPPPRRKKRDRSYDQPAMP
jgi:hypothetical protein